MTLLPGGCPPQPSDPGVNPPATSPIYRNTTDPQDSGASFVGTAACAACHTDIGDAYVTHGHVAAGFFGCETCHGPGSNHVPTPSRRDLFVDITIDGCAKCHGSLSEPESIFAADGYIRPLVQYSELRASGGHASFNCRFCHDPHASTADPAGRGIINDCRACHREANMAFHDNLVYIQGDYVEPLSCESCHMPFTGLRDMAAGPDAVGESGRAGDVRGHIFRIDTTEAEFTAMFTPDGTRVQRDSRGRAAVTLDFVCLRCHHGLGNAFPLRADGPLDIAPNIHRNADLFGP